MSPYNFTCEHRHGRLIAHADALSRYLSQPATADDTSFNDLNISMDEIRMISYISPSFIAEDFKVMFDIQTIHAVTAKLKPEECPSLPQQRGLFWKKGEKKTSNGNANEDENADRIWIPPQLRKQLM